MSLARTGSPRTMIASAFLAFAAFGSVWGVWGASVPRVQQQAGVDDGQLGVALLFVGAAALPAMLGIGRALDRYGLRVAAVAISGLGIAGATLALTAVNMAALCAGLALVGACSGAADVAMNAVAGRAEMLAGQPVITRAHGVFSSFVVLGSLGTGLTNGASLPVAAPFIAVAVLSIVAGVAMFTTLRSATTAHEPDPVAAPHRAVGTGTVAIVLIGVLGALAFASENAHQSWSAVFAHNELDASDGLASLAPAIFAATVAITRFSIGGLKPRYAQAVLLSGASVAAVGAVIIAAAPNLVIDLAGLVVAAAGTAVLFPTLLGLVSRNVQESYRGRATSLVTSVSYLGFLLGPVYVGFWADVAGLRAAMLAVAALAAVLVVLIPALVRLSRFSPTRGSPRESESAGRSSGRGE
jgi:MFS family permease